MVGTIHSTVNRKPVTVNGYIDVFGNTPEGKLERLPQYPHVFWMVWSHWFPDTRVMN